MQWLVADTSADLITAPMQILQLRGIHQRDEGLELLELIGKVTTGGQLPTGHPLNSDFSTGQNSAVLARMFVFLQIDAFVWLKMAYRLSWL
jgi:hypothetical protein